LLEIAEDFIRSSSKEHGKRFQGVDESAATVLLQHEWPGNIRQLQNAIQRAIVLAQDHPGKSLLSAQDFEFLNESPKSEALPSLSDAKEQFIRNYVKKAILIHKGNKTKAAKALGVDPKTLYRHLAGEDD
jgi:DNA-binding NtrC family response regulator